MVAYTKDTVLDLFNKLLESDNPLCWKAAPMMHTLYNQLTARDKEIERLREALEKIVALWTTNQDEVMQEYADCGTEAFCDPDWMYASSIKSVCDIARQALTPTPQNAEGE